MDWNQDAIARLRAMWDEGLTTAEIGRRLGVTKNAVVGKSHRLLLPPRPSPIRRAVDAQVPRPAAPRSPGPASPPLVTSARVVASVAQTPIVVARVVSAPVQVRPALHAVPSLSKGRTTNCCWPIGDPGTAGFRFCDDTAMASKPYCAAHASLAYVKVRDRREDAA